MVRKIWSIAAFLSSYFRQQRCHAKGACSCLDWEREDEAGHDTVLRHLMCFHMAERLEVILAKLQI